MTSYFIMNRTGEFEPYGMTSNQCKAPEHKKYYYHLKLVFDGECELDKDAFIVDHQEIDDLVASLPLLGSCEQMQLQLSRQLLPMFQDRDIPLLACKCVIKPTKSDGPAWLEYVSLKAPAYAACLALT